MYHCQCKETMQRPCLHLFRYLFYLYLFYLFGPFIYIWIRVYVKKQTNVYKISVHKRIYICVNKPCLTCTHISSPWRQWWKANTHPARACPVTRELKTASVIGRSLLFMKPKILLQSTATHRDQHHGEYRSFQFNITTSWFCVTITEHF